MAELLVGASFIAMSYLSSSCFGIVQEFVCGVNNSAGKRLHVIRGKNIVEGRHKFAERMTAM